MTSLAVFSPVSREPETSSAGLEGGRCPEREETGGQEARAAAAAQTAGGSPSPPAPPVKPEKPVKTGKPFKPASPTASQLPWATTRPE